MKNHKYPAGTPDVAGITEKGSYILLCRLLHNMEIHAGELGNIAFPFGYYAYVGSAMGGLGKRVARHLGSNKKIHWHIDYLLEEAVVGRVIVCPSEKKLECEIARILGSRYEVIYGFGSSDCKCPGHLFYDSGKMADEIKSILNTAGLKSKQILINER